MNTFSHLLQYFVEFVLERKYLKQSSREKPNTHFMVSNFFFPPRKSCHLRDNVEKCVGARQVSNNMAHARCMLDKKVTSAKPHANARALTRTKTHAPKHAQAGTHSRARKHAQKHTRTFCFSTTTMVSWTCLNVRLCFYCLSFSFS